MNNEDATAEEVTAAVLADCVVAERSEQADALAAAVVEDLKTRPPRKPRPPDPAVLDKLRKEASR